MAKKKQEDEVVETATKGKGPSNLDIVKKAIEKKYGDVITTLGSADTTIRTVSTGLLGLDLALGRGGIAEGRILEVFGPPAGGKCVTEDTYLSTEFGLLTINELFALNGTPTAVTNKALPNTVGLRNEFGDLENTSHFVWNNRRPVNHVGTTAGLEIKATDQHRLRVIDPDTGFVVWKKCKDLVIGDALVIETCPNTSEFKDQISVDEATLIGMLVAEGYMNQDNHFSFTNVDFGMLQLFSKLCKDLLGFDDVITYEHTNEAGSSLTKTARVNSKLLRSLLLTQYGLDKCTAYGKNVPAVVRCSSNKIVAAFLSAYFSLDGCYERHSRITASSASHELLKQIQLLLLDRFSIKSVVKSKYNKTYERDYYHIDISAEDAQQFLDDIGFILQNKLDKVAVLHTGSESKSRRWGFPYQTGLIKALNADLEGTSRESDDLFGKLISRGDILSLSKLQEILTFTATLEKGQTAALVLSHFNRLSTCACTTITSIAREEAVPVFDVVMPKTHSFISNGIISHNTTLTMRIIAQNQALGRTCGFIDAERSADPQLFQKMGVNVDKLVYARAYTGDENLEIAEALLKSGEISLLVIDSVSALIPKQEAEADIGKEHMALLARLMSKALRKLTPLAGMANANVIFINQIRHDVGAWGNDEVTTGGEAINFYSSYRIRASGGDTKKSRIIEPLSGEVVGHQTTFDVIKNKLSTPYRKATVDLIYGVGYDLYGEVLSMAVDLGIIDKAGAWFKYNGEHIGQGEFQVRDTFAGNNVLFNEVRDKVIDVTGLKAEYDKQASLRRS